MVKNNKFNLVLGGFFLCLGLVMPIIFHLFGLGKVFLPMFLPMMIMAFLVPMDIGILVAVLTPLISSLLTGMPPLYPPTALIMSLEGAAMVGAASFLYYHRGANFWVAFFAGVLAGRAMLVLAIYLIAPILGFPGMISLAALLANLPGILLQILVVPTVVFALKPRVLRLRSIA